MSSKSHFFSNTLFSNFYYKKKQCTPMHSQRKKVFNNLVLQRFYKILIFIFINTNDFIQYKVRCSYEHSIVAHELEFSFKIGTSIGCAVSFSVDAVLPFADAMSVFAALSCAVCSSQFILNLVTLGSDAKMLRTT